MSALGNKEIMEMSKTDTTEDAILWVRQTKNKFK